MLFSQIFPPEIHQFCWKSFTTMHVVLLGNFQKIPMFGCQIREKMDHLVYIYVHPANCLNISEFVSKTISKHQKPSKNAKKTSKKSRKAFKHITFGELLYPFFFIFDQRKFL